MLKLESLLAPVLVFCGRLFAYVRMASGSYKWWSDIYRWLYERQYKDVQISTFDDVAQLSKWIGRQKWKADSWKELWDAVSSPQKIQVLGQAKDGDHFIGDCDEFAIYSVAAIQASLAAGLMKAENIKTTWLLSTVWFNPNTTVNFGFNGHNVCLIEYNDGPKYAYMDYAMPSTRTDSVAAITEFIRQRYSGAGVIPLSWCVSKLDLTPVETKWG